jgi:hypothetical protein
MVAGNGKPVVGVEPESSDLAPQVGFELTIVPLTPDRVLPGFAVVVQFVTAFLLD